LHILFSFCSLLRRSQLLSTLFPYTTLFRSSNNCQGTGCITQPTGSETIFGVTRTWGFQQGFYIFTAATILVLVGMVFLRALGLRSEEHTSELQSRENLVCRLLLEKKKKTQK